MCPQSNDTTFSQHHITQHARPTEIHHLNILSISTQSQDPSLANLPRITFAHFMLSVSLSPAIAKNSNTMHPLNVAMVMVLVMGLMVHETKAECPTNDLSSCLPAAEADVQPTEECCTNLAAYTETDTPGECMCEGALNSALMDDDDMNAQFTVLIPQKCNLQYPAGITCSGYVVPGGQ